MMRGAAGLVLGCTCALGCAGVCGTPGERVEPPIVRTANGEFTRKAEPPHIITESEVAECRERVRGAGLAVTEGVKAFGDGLRRTDAPACFNSWACGRCSVCAKRQAYDASGVCVRVVDCY